MSDRTDVERHSRFAELLKAAQRGSPAELGTLLEAYRPYLLLIANSELDSGLRAKAGASDLVQETCLRAQAGLGQFAGTTEAEFLGWLRTILLHAISNFSRGFHGTQKRDVAAEIPLQSGSGVRVGIDPVARQEPPSAELRRQEERELILAAVSRLPEHYREVILLRYVEERGMEEIAEKIGKSVEATWKLWYRGLELLEQELADRL